MATFFVGQIIQFGGNFTISGTAQCSGQLLAISQNTALFSILGTTFGGDGVTTFALPDLRGRRMIHQGQGPGLSNYVLGEVAGVEATTVTQTTMPTHTHTITSSFKASSTTNATAQLPSANSVLGRSADIASGGTAHPAIYCPSSAPVDAALGGLNVAAANAGSSLPVEILNPFLVINCLISLFGVFPSRN